MANWKIHKNDCAIQIAHILGGKEARQTAIEMRSQLRTIGKLSRILEEAEKDDEIVRTQVVLSNLIKNFENSLNDTILSKDKKSEILNMNLYDTNLLESAIQTRLPIIVSILIAHGAVVHFPHFVAAVQQRLASMLRILLRETKMMLWVEDIFHQTIDLYEEELARVVVEEKLARKITETRDVKRWSYEKFSDTKEYQKITMLHELQEYGLLKMLVDTSDIAWLGEAIMQRGEDEFALNLIESGVNLEVKIHSGNTPLMLAISNAKTDIFRALINAGANVNAKDKSGMAPIHQIANSIHVDTDKRIEMIRLLLEKDAGIIDARAQRNQTALQLASENAKNFGIVRFLVQNGADPNTKNTRGVTPLMQAVLGRNVEAVRFLIGAGAEVNAEDYQGQKVLNYAITNKNDEIYRMLKEAGATL